MWAPSVCTARSMICETVRMRPKAASSPKRSENAVNPTTSAKRITSCRRSASTRSSPKVPKGGINGMTGSQCRSSIHAASPRDVDSEGGKIPRRLRDHAPRRQRQDRAGLGQVKPPGSGCKPNALTVEAKGGDGRQNSRADHHAEPSLRSRPHRVRLREPGPNPLQGSVHGSRGWRKRPFARH